MLNFKQQTEMANNRTTSIRSSTQHLWVSNPDTPTFRQVAQLSQRDGAAGCVIVFAKSRRLELGDNILQTL